MRTIEERYCISQTGVVLSTYSEKEKFALSELTTETHRELLKVVAMIVRDYKVTVSLDTIRREGINILNIFDEAIQQGTIKERTNTDGYVTTDYSKNALVFVSNPRLFDNIIKRNGKNKGQVIVDVLRLIKRNINNVEFIKTLNDYYNMNIGKSYSIKYSVDVQDLKVLISHLLGVEVKQASKIIYAMKHKGNYDISVKRMAKRYKGSFISDVFIYLGSVK